MALWWLSYANESSSSLVIVRASSFLEAAARSRELDLSPGGQVRGWQVPAPYEAKLLPYENRRLTEAEVRELLGL